MGLNEIEQLTESELRERFHRLAQELYYWQHGADNFTAELFHLISKADPNNREKIRDGFPDEVAIYEMWQQSPTEQIFYKLMGIVEVRP